MIYNDTTAIEAVNTGRETPDAFYAKSTLMATAKWHNTDGWRGHFELTPEPGFKLLDSDWVTGNWDDAPDGNSSDDVETRLKELEAKHGNIYVIFTPTSNVFSTAFDVLVRDKTVKPVKGKTIGHKTKLFTEPDGSYRVKYHATDVISYNAKTGVYTLNSGGWLTKTTKERINSKLPRDYWIYQKNFEWYLTTPDGVIEFKDGMEVTA